MAEKIGAWIRDPRNNFLKGQSKRAALYELYCERPETCDLLQKENTCLHCGAVTSCRFGKKRSTEGPTTRARSFSSTLTKWREQNEGYIGKLAPLKAYNRIFKTHGYFYLPYAHMAKEGLGGMGHDQPLESKWIPEEDMTTDLLARICEAKPKALMGGVIPSYQTEQIPKFISDLKAHYPEVFALLPEDQKARLETISHVGRKADITTCAPGQYRFGRFHWEWDGEYLHGKDMLMPPVPGDIHIKIRPKPGSPVEITDDSQVTDTTRFID